jgi:hypothetical protein
MHNGGMASPQTLLDATEQAILNCLAAQDYSVAGRRKQMAQLRDLRELRQQLKDEISAGATSSGGMATLLSLGDATP